MLKKFLLIITAIFFLILASFSVLGSMYGIDTDNDGNPDVILPDITDLEWQISFRSYGSIENDTGNLPAL
ncbi:unnamed protein product, partial [marine sediment metagenome]